MTLDDNATLYPLGDRGETIDGLLNDVRGRDVKDAAGAGLGTVVDLLVDDKEKKVRFLLVEHGGFLGLGATKSLIPVEAITKTTTHDVLIDQSRDRVAAAPAYDPKLIDDRVYHAGIYDHYGYAPYWGRGHLGSKDGMYHL